LRNDRAFPPPTVALIRAHAGGTRARTPQVIHGPKKGVRALLKKGQLGWPRQSRAAGSGGRAGSIERHYQGNDADEHPRNRHKKTPTILAGRSGPVRKANEAPPDASLHRCGSHSAVRFERPIARRAPQTPRATRLPFACQLSMTVPTRSVLFASEVPSTAHHDSIRLVTDLARNCRLRGPDHGGGKRRDGITALSHS
jgi:hypothetical protein